MRRVIVMTLRLESCSSVTWHESVSRTDIYFIVEMLLLAAELVKGMGGAGTENGFVLLIVFTLNVVVLKCLCVCMFNCTSAAYSYYFA